MIVNREILTGCDPDGNVTKTELISYVGADGTIKFLNYPIPKDWWFNWSYSRYGDRSADPYYRSWDGKPVTKRFLDDNRDICENREHEILCSMVKAYPQMSVLYDMNIPTTAFMDIEVEVDGSGFPEPSKAQSPVTTISYVVGDVVTVFGRAALTDEQISGIVKKVKEHTERFGVDYTFVYRYYGNEYDMLEDFFFNYVKNVPALTGWNLFGFDWPYLYNRCKNIGLDIRNISPTGKWTKHKVLKSEITAEIPMHKVIYDYLEIYKKWDRTVEVKENSTLDFVASAALGVTKVKHSLGFQDMWEQEPDNYVFYNAIDSILVAELDKKIKTSKTMYALANLTHVDLLNNISPVRTIEIVQCEYAWMDGKVFPNVKNNAVKQDYEGAYVYPTIPGIYRNILALDFNSLYPTTQRQLNISPDTYIKKDKSYTPKADEIKTVSGAVYKRNEKGLLPKILTDFYAKRKGFKKVMMAADDEINYLENVYERRTSKAMS